jgi:hypothetical protein
MRCSTLSIDLIILFVFFDSKDIFEGLFKAYCDGCDGYEADMSDNNLDRLRNTRPGIF